MKTKYIFLLLVFSAILINGCVEGEVFVGPSTISSVTIDPHAGCQACNRHD